MVGARVVLASGAPATVPAMALQTSPERPAPVRVVSQAIGGWNGPGPYVISNNFLEAAGENVMACAKGAVVSGRCVPMGVAGRAGRRRRRGWDGPLEADRIVTFLPAGAERPPRLLEIQRRQLADEDLGDVDDRPSPRVGRRQRADPGSMHTP